MPQALTDEQRQFAAENHNLIYKYLWDRRLEIDDYYDIAVFGYLRAVKRYLTEPWLRRYQFSTVDCSNFLDLSTAYPYRNILPR